MLAQGRAPPIVGFVIIKSLCVIFRADALLVVN